MTLESEDCDIKHLIRYLLIAIKGLEPNDGTIEESARSSALSYDMPPRAALSVIIKHIAEEKCPFIIVIDDLHHADNKSVTDFMKSLIMYAPGNCHFVLASRNYPNLGQLVLAAENQLVEINVDDLRFSADEIKTLFYANDTNCYNTENAENENNKFISKIINRT